jgi:hypothetical protein
MVPDPKSIVVIEWDIYSAIYSTNRVVDEFLHGDFTHSGSLTYQPLVSKLPLVLDVIFQCIANGKSEALFPVINLFPGRNDPQYPEVVEGDPNSESGIQPIDHLMYYAKYCAFRKSDEDCFDNLVTFWGKKLEETPVSPDRKRFAISSIPPPDHPERLAR